MAAEAQLSQGMASNMVQGMLFQYFKVYVKSRGTDCKNSDNFFILHRIFVFSIGINSCTHFFFYRQLGCLAFSLRFWPKIKQFLSNCPASDWSFTFQTADFC